jgi:predicted RNase H-like nuclease (RuvC/YqgF family)
MTEDLTGKNAEIVKLRSDISKILSKKNATDAELKKARVMIAELNGKIEGLAAEVDRLEGENKSLSEENSNIKEEKKQVEGYLANTESAKANVEKELENTKDVASTLKASNITITPLNEKSSGKEKETTNAKKADKLRINFTIDENRLAKSGKKDLYVVITDPAGKVVNYSPSDVFILRDSKSQLYTSKVSVNYETGKALPVSFDWKNDKTFSEGNYKIEIYNNGFKIGEQVRTLKKGGLFN